MAIGGETTLFVSVELMDSVTSRRRLGRGTDPAEFILFAVDTATGAILST